MQFLESVIFQQKISIPLQILQRATFTWDCHDHLTECIRFLVLPSDKFMGSVNQCNMDGVSRGIELWCGPYSVWVTGNWARGWLQCTGIYVWNYQWWVHGVELLCIKPKCIMQISPWWDVKRSYAWGKLWTPLRHQLCSNTVYILYNLLPGCIAIGLYFLHHA